MDATCAIQASIHVFSLVRKYVSRILGTYQSGSHSLFLIRASRFELSTATLPAQLTQTRHPRGTQEIPLSAALFPT